MGMKSLCHFTYLINVLPLEYFICLQSFSIIMIVSMFHYNFKVLSSAIYCIVKCYLLFLLMIFEDNMLVRVKFYRY